HVGVEPAGVVGGTSLRLDVVRPALRQLVGGPLLAELLDRDAGGDARLAFGDLLRHPRPLPLRHGRGRLCYPGLAHLTAAAHLAAETEPRARPVRKEGPHPVVPGPVLDGASAVGALGSLGEHDGHGSDPPIAWASSSRAAADPHASKRSSRAVSSAISGRAGGPLRARLTAHRTAPRAPSIWDRMRSCTACKRRKVRRSTASRLGAALPVVSS